jgi:hypothetical protein
MKIWNGARCGKKPCLVDGARNIKGDPSIYAYYTRPLQIVIQRKTTTDGKAAKYFSTRPGNRRSKSN